MLCMDHKLGRGVKGFVLKYHTDPTIRIASNYLRKSVTRVASETHSSCLFNI